MPPKMPSAKSLLESSKSKPIIVLFFMNGCPHCEMMMPDWKRAVEQFQGGSHRGRALTAEVEYSAMASLPPQLRTIVNGFPTILVIKDGKPGAEYAGDRSAESILAFIHMHCEGPVAASKRKSVKGGAEPTQRPSAKRTKSKKKV